MAINVSQAFHRTSANPVDDTMTLTKAQMLTVNDNLMPSYYFTVCQDDGFIYLYDKSATASAETGKFTKFEGGGGGESGEATLITVTLLASGWSNGSQTITATGVSSSSNGVVGMLNTATAAQIEAATDAVLTVTTVGTNSITFVCENEPEIDIPVGILLGGGGSGVPDGGTTGQVLMKQSNTDGDADWDDIPSENDYSTEERMVGTWIDGKPIYQKTWRYDQPITLTYSTWVETPISNTNLKRIISGQLNDIFTDNGVELSNTIDYVSFALNVNNKVGVFSVRNQETTRPAYFITLKYTKTTD